MVDWDKPLQISLDNGRSFRLAAIVYFNEYDEVYCVAMLSGWGYGVFRFYFGSDGTFIGDNGYGIFDSGDVLIRNSNTH